jgi:putative peptidoglycan lipid II flippase
MYLAGWFATPGHAAAWAVTASGLFQLVLLGYAARRAGILALPRWPRRDPDLGLFFRRFVPAVIGAAGTQIAMFADTIISSLLPTGAPSAIYYADRIYQLPIGVIAIAAGTVLLPEMSRRFANNDIDGAHVAQNRVVALTALMTLPFVVAFLLLAEPIMQGAFGRGKFDLEAAQAAGGVLAAYGVGLPAIVLIRAAVAGFQARGDTQTPMMFALIAVACNVALKLVLTGPLGTPGLALATSAGAWVNLVLLVAIGWRRGWMAPDRALLKRLGAGLAAALVLAGATLALEAPVGALSLRLPHFQAEGFLMLIGTAGAVIYGAMLVLSLRLAGVPLRRR